MRMSEREQIIINENRKLIKYCTSCMIKIISRNYKFNGMQEIKENSFKYYEMLFIGSLSNMKEQATKENKLIIKKAFTVPKEQNIFKDDKFLFY